MDLLEDVYVYFITMSINISIPDRRYSYVYFITIFINISIPDRRYSYLYFILYLLSGILILMDIVIKYT
jgi:hypothetical protein